MISTTRRAAGAIILLAAFAAPATAADCRPQTLMAAVDLQSADHAVAEFVPVDLGDLHKVMLLDTGGAVSEIIPPLVDELKLTRQKGMIEIVDVAGQKSHDYVNAPLTLGKLRSNAVKLIVMPGSNHYSDQPGFAGILAPDILRNFDIDIDFGTHKLNLISPDHCEGKVIYWPAAAVAVVPISLQEDSGHIVVPVTLDGHKVYALIDTGATTTTLIQSDAVTYYGITPGSADAPRVGDLQDSPGMAVYEHIFKTLEFEGITINNPHVELIPDRVSQHFETQDAPAIGTKIRDVDTSTRARMLIGMNILKHFHIYIAYGEKRLYITPAGEAPPPAAAH